MKRTNTQKNRQVKPQLDALLIKSAQGKLYVEVLWKLRANVKSEETATEIKTVRNTRTGDMLLELASKR